MNWEDVKKSFNSKFNDWTDVASDYKYGVENEQKDVPEAHITWVRMTVRFGRVFDGEFGGVGVQGGIAFFDVFTPLGSGDVPGLELCDSLRSHFKDEVLTYNGGRVSCEQVDINPLGKGDLFNQNQVKVNFTNFVE